jgi:hypothetical protein
LRQATIRELIPFCGVTLHYGVCSGEGGIRFDRQAELIAALNIGDGFNRGKTKCCGGAVTHETARTLPRNDHAFGFQAPQRSPQDWPGNTDHERKIILGRKLGVRAEFAARYAGRQLLVNTVSERGGPGFWAPFSLVPWQAGITGLVHHFLVHPIHAVLDNGDFTAAWYSCGFFIASAFTKVSSFPKPPDLLIHAIIEPSAAGISNHARPGAASPRT